MSCGLPIVASPVNGVPYEVKDGENGFLVLYGDKTNLKKKILEIIDHPDLALEFSHKNREKARRFEWDVIIQEYMKVYHGEIKNHF